jgi:hypothetical protein
LLKAKSFLDLWPWAFESGIKQELPTHTPSQAQRSGVIVSL